MIMEITELMIGDIVQYLDGKKLITVVVVKVDGSGNVVRLKQKNGHKFNTTIDFLRPIPLTPEILEKNFQDFDNDEYTFGWWPHEKLGAFLVEWQNHKREIVSKLVYNIHELQHILLICSINKQISLP